MVKSINNHSHKKKKKQQANKYIRVGFGVGHPVGLGVGFGVGLGVGRGVGLAKSHITPNKNKT